MARTTPRLSLAFVPLVNFCSIHRLGVPIRRFSISVIRVISGQISDGCGLIALGVSWATPTVLRQSSFHRRRKSSSRP
jgi:hypothetical protein